jgi:hypothetical protein
MGMKSLFGISAILLATTGWMMKRRRRSLAERATGWGMSSVRWMRRAFGGSAAKMLRMSGRGIRAMIR